MSRRRLVGADRTGPKVIAGGGSRHKETRTPTEASLQQCTTFRSLVCPPRTSSCHSPSSSTPVPMAVSSRRLHKELMSLKMEGTPVGMPSLLLRVDFESIEARSWIPGIELLSADDFATWYLSVEVLGDTVYEVRPSESLILCALRSDPIRLYACRERSSPSSSASTTNTRSPRPPSSSSSTTGTPRPYTPYVPTPFHMHTPCPPSPARPAHVDSDPRLLLASHLARLLERPCKLRAPRIVPHHNIP